MGGGELDLMKAGAGLVNYSRAGLVDYEALRVRLKKGRTKRGPGCVYAGTLAEGLSAVGGVKTIDYAALFLR
ncbi:MAG: hypothetical protein CM1200mP41_37940 [Gammaproteobacteria bacterium]|nr:MAG: hypothetical protein CM1200mP41_37940 [Gammaproteobacteria bacterium]